MDVHRVAAGGGRTDSFRPLLLAVPNVSEGRDAAVLDAIGTAFTTGGAHLLDVHSDADHHRSVFTLAGRPGELAAAVLAGALEAVARIDLTAHDGIHPRVGAIDVAPIVHLTGEDRGAACAEALVLADELGRAGLPAFLYGALAGGRTRAELRRGGPQGLGERMAGGLAPDFGPHRLHPTAGAVLVAARPPLVAFNLAVAASLEQARAVAAELRAALPAVKALGLALERQGIVQVSTNIDDHTAVSAAEVVAFVRERIPVTAAELVALAPEAAFAGFPEDVPLTGFDPSRHLIERAIRSLP
jgi:glutamate formiminotransferase